MLTYLAIGLMMSVFSWLIDDHLKLRKRVAQLEQLVGAGKPDRLAELMGDNDQ